MRRRIVHLDADAFFASVEQAADSRLRGKAIAVGGEKRGIIASASYEARRYGIYTPMPTAHARKLCPQLVLLPGDFEKYEQFSRWMFSYAYDFSPDVEISSIDEGYIDLSGSRHAPHQVAETVRKAVYDALKISISEGIGTNKLISQIASRIRKPRALVQVPPGQEKAFLHPLSNRWLPGIGPHTAIRMNAAGLTHVGQIAGTPVDCLALLVGATAPTLRQFANGIDDRPVEPAEAPAKSYGQQQTFDEDTIDEPFVEATLRRMLDRLMAAVREDGKMVRTLTVKVRFNDMAEQQRSESILEPTDLESDLYGRIRPLLRQAWDRRVSLRMVSCKLSHIYAGFGRSELPLNGPTQTYDARRRLAGVVCELRHRYGRTSIQRGHDVVVEGLKVKSRTVEGRRSESRTSTPHVRVEGQPATSDFRPATFRPTTTSSYAPLHVHSHYSFLDSTLSPREIVDLAVKYKCPAVALTDTGNLHGAVEFTLAALAAGIRPILGAEIAVDGNPLLLYVENKTGYTNLCRLLSGHAPGAPVALTSSTFDADTAGLIAVAADTALAHKFPHSFYQGCSKPKSAIRHSAFGIRHSLPVPAVHYATPADRKHFHLLQSIRTLTLLGQPHPAKRRGAYPFLSPRALHERFRECPGMVERTLEIADRCTFQLTFGRLQFPGFHPPDGSTPHAFLRTLVQRGVKERYGKRTEKVRAQIEEELAVIAEVGYEEYFLVVWDLLQRCARRGIEWITRGSAADSLVCYCLGISDVCPIRFDLYFRRFLNRERMQLNKLPDIDIDFAHDRKDDVVDLVFETYGPEYAAVVGGFSTFQSRSALGDIAKVLGVSEYQVRQITRRIPHLRARDIDEAKNHVQCGDLPFDEDPYVTALEAARRLDNVPRNPKMHPCGVVLSRVPIQTLTPCFVSAKHYPTTHFDMDAVEEIGLVKIDILAQGGLGVLRDARASLRERDITIDLKTFTARGGASKVARLPPRACTGGGGQEGRTSKVPSLNTEHPAVEASLHCRAGRTLKTEPWTDPDVWEMIASGQGRAVHHIESPAMISLCRMCNVRDIDTLIAIVSVIRPGAANEKKKQHFTLRYQGLEAVTYPHPSLEPCLRCTFGMIVYEEQVLQICEAFAAMPPGESDLLRRALNKRDWDKAKTFGKQFWRRAREEGRTREEIKTVWLFLCGFNGYSFCKAHSTAYGVEAYQGAWLKKYFPAEFMAAVLTNGKGFYPTLVYVLECHRFGIRMRPPCVNDPGPGYRVRDGHHIRVPVARVRGLTHRFNDELLEARGQGPFTSLHNLFRRTAPSREELEILLRVGALDVFTQRRADLFWDIQWLAASYDPAGRGQGSLFTEAADHPRPPVALTEPNPLQRLQAENDLLGFTAGDHPLALYPDIAWESYCPVAELKDHLGEEVTTCGLIVIDRVVYHDDGEQMKFLTLADRTGMVETQLFKHAYKTFGLATVRYPVLEVTGTVEPFANERGFTLNIHHAGKPRTRSETTEEGDHEMHERHENADAANNHVLALSIQKNKRIS